MFGSIIKSKLGSKLYFLLSSSLRNSKEMKSKVWTFPGHELANNFITSG